MLDALAITEETLGLLEKAALEADSLESEVIRLKAELQKVSTQLQKKASAPVINHSLLLKVAEALEAEELLADTMTAEKLASLYAEDPNRLADITLRLLCPATSDGKPVKKAAAETTTQSPGSGKLVSFEGRQVIDHDGWMSALR